MDQEKKKKLLPRHRLGKCVGCLCRPRQFVLGYMTALGNKVPVPAQPPEQGG